MKTVSLRRCPRYEADVPTQEAAQKADARLLGAYEHGGGASGHQEATLKGPQAAERIKTLGFGWILAAATGLEIVCSGWDACSWSDAGAGDGG